MENYQKLNTLIQGLKSGSNEIDEVINILAQEEVLLGIYTQARKLGRKFGFDSEYYKDLTQQYFQSILEKGMNVKEPFKSDLHMYNAIGGIMKKILINACRKHQKRSDREMKYTSFVEKATETEENEANTSYKKTIQNAIGTLPRKEKQAAILRYGESMPVKEVAREMEVTESAAKGLISRARKKIIEFLKHKTEKKIQNVRKRRI